MRSWKAFSIISLVAILVATGFFFVTRPAPVALASSITFVNFQLGTAAVGEVCPNHTAPCVNHAAEPAIRADPAGNFYVSSENGLGAGTEAWRSHDTGANSALHYAAIPSPDAVSQGSSFAPGGGDTDLAVAPVKNFAGYYNVYVASLSLANVDVSTSMNGGKSFSLNPIGATISGDDREWIAADGPSKVCLSYHDVATDNIVVNCSFDAGKTFTQVGQAFDATHLYNTDNNAIGNLMIDPHTHYVYQTFSGIDQADLTNPNAGTHVVYMAVSTDGGKTFTDYKVYDNPNATLSYGHQFVNVSIDSFGNVYSVYSDNHNVYYSFSTTHGQTWHGPYRVNASPSATAIFPWSVAGDGGEIDIVWYGTAYYSPTTPPDNYPNSAAWYVYFAQNINATTSTTFTQVRATPIIHYGGVCEGGVTCTGNRDLYDDFGVAVNTATGGLASIVYSDDQYDAGQPTTCTRAQNNTSSCDHTAIATQYSGEGILSVSPLH